MRSDHDVYRSVRDAAQVEAGSLIYGTPAIFAARCIKR
jgi:hypothetical protein